MPFAPFIDFFEYILAYISVQYKIIFHERQQESVYFSVLILKRRLWYYWIDLTKSYKKSIKNT